MFDSSSVSRPKRHTCSSTLILEIGAMATIKRILTSMMRNFELDQAGLIRDLVARLKELENNLSIMKDTEGSASTDNHDKLKPTEIKDIERPDMYDNHVAKFNTGFYKFKELLTSPDRSWEKLLGV